MSAKAGVSIKIKSGGVELDGDLNMPERANALVLFAHGSGSSRFSARNRYVAGELQKAGFATLLMDLLTKGEEAIDSMTGELRFDIALLARRVIAATDWLARDERTAGLKVGYFGASTGASAALVAAAERASAVKAVVSRGGRPDLAGEALERVKAPTLLIVGGDDHPVIEMNEGAFELLKSKKKMVIVPGATHLFEEPGKLEKVAELAREWFKEHLV